MGRIPQVETDVLVVGAGGAGMMAAIAAAQAGMAVVLTSKGPFGKSGATSMTFGVGGMRVGDPATHYQQTMEAGDFLNDPELVANFCRRAPDIVDYLRKLGVSLRETERSASFQDQRPEVLLPQFQRLGIRVLDDFFLVDLLTAEGQACGALGIRLGNGELLAINAHAVVLATGGYGRLFTSYGPCCVEATGDGVAMAYRAGAELVDMEFVQFHPGTAVFPESIKGHNISLYGRGARLYNAEGDEFISDYGAYRADLTRQIALQIAQGKGSPRGGVYLDCSEVDGGSLESRSYISEFIAREAQVDLRRTRVEIRPSAHYSMGGIRIDAACRTTVSGLFCAGEAAGGVHGSNRLGANALPDAFTLGRVAGQSAAEYVGSDRRPGLWAEVPASAIERALAPLAYVGQEGVTPSSLTRQLQAVMGDEVGPLRDAPGLRRALGEIEDIRETAQSSLSLATDTRRYNRQWFEALELSNMVVLAGVVAEAAMAREESRGSHVRVDHEGRDDGEWLANLIARAGRDRPNLEVRRRLPEPPSYEEVLR